MNQGFKLRFDQMRENDPSSVDASENTNEIDTHQQPSFVRNVCLIWPDGRKMFLNYAYLVAAEFDPSNDTNLITLRFSLHTIFLKGYGLEPLFMALLDHRPRIITATDSRYVLEDEKELSVVIDIRVERKDE